ncbi:MAG: hypothetical protein ACK5DM_11595, partial [Planctomyces sp.]
INRVQYDFDNRTISDTTIPVVLPANSQRIFNTGSMVIPGFELEGTFELINGPDAIAVTFDATFRAFDALFLHTAGGVNIVKGSNPGIVISLNATVESGFFGVDSVFEMDSTFHLKVNTRSGGSADQYDLGIARGMVRIDINGQIILLGTINLQMGGYIESYAGVFRVQASGSMELLGQYVSGSAFFSSEGEFQVSFGGGIQIGPSGFGVSGSTNFSISRLDGNGTQSYGDGNYVVNVSGIVQGTVQIFGMTLGGASIAFGLDGNTGRVYITPSITLNFFLFSITFSTTFNLFYVKIPRPVYLGGNESDGGGTAFNRGVLYLNTGARAHMRDEAEEEINEGYVISRIGNDPDYPGEILRLQAFGRSQTFRGVTGIVADLGSGHDYLEIGAGVQAPLTILGGNGYDYLIQNGSGGVYFEGDDGPTYVRVSDSVRSAVEIYGGTDEDDILIEGTHLAPVTIFANAGNDTVTYNGSAAALINGGLGDDILQGGSGANVFQFEDDFGYDTVTKLGGTAEMDFSRVYEPIDARVTTLNANITGSRDFQKVLALGSISGVPVKLLPLGINEITVLFPGHNFKAGDTVDIHAPDTPEFNGAFQIHTVSENTFSIVPTRTLYMGQQATLNAAGGFIDRGVFFIHDGLETAYFHGNTSTLNPGTWSFSSSNRGYNGTFDVQRVDADWFSITVPWADVRPEVTADFLPELFRSGKGNDLITFAADIPALPLIDAGGFDRLNVVGTIGSFARVTTGSLETAGQSLIYTGIEFVVLRDPTANITVTGATETAALELPGMNLGVVATSLELPVNISADGLDIVVRDSLTLAHALQLNTLDARVVGDDAELTITQPLVFGQTAQLSVPDGIVNLPGGTTANGGRFAVRARGLNTIGGTMTVALDALTLITDGNAEAAFPIINDRDLLLTRWVTPGRLQLMDSLIADVFENITWIADVASEWSNQMFDGALNPVAVAAKGPVSVTLPIFSNNDEDGLIVDGRLKSYTGAMTLTADEMDFRGGQGSVQAPGALTIRAATAVWSYRLGTAAESQSGAPLSTILAPNSLDLTTRDVAALADGFTEITIGRSDAGNLMRIGDAYNLTQVKATGLPRVQDASIKDPISLLAQTFIVEGDFRVPDSPLSMQGHTLDVRRTNLHMPDNANPDAGLYSTETVVEMSEQVVVSGWIRGADLVQIDITNSTGTNAILN